MSTTKATQSEAKGVDIQMTVGDSEEFLHMKDETKPEAWITMAVHGDLTTDIER